MKVPVCEIGHVNVQCAVLLVLAIVGGRSDLDQSCLMNPKWISKRDSLCLGSHVLRHPTSNEHVRIKDIHTGVL